MEQKSSVVKPYNDWRSRLHELIRTQMDMERKWNQMREKKGFVMKELDVSNLGDHDSELAGADIIKIVVISDTHSTHNRISVPPGMNINIHINNKSCYFSVKL